MNSTANGTQPVLPSTGREPQIDPVRLQAFLQELRDRQNLLLGAIAGAVAAAVAAVIWAIISVAANYQIGWMAVGVGFLVGYAVRRFGQGVDRPFGFVGAGLSLLSCLAGNLLIIAIVVSRQEAVPILDVLFFFFVMSPGIVVQAMIGTFRPVDLLFYGLALYEGYKFAFRRITRAELVSLAR